MKGHVLKLILWLTLAVPTGCATPGPQGPVPLYDFDSVWFNPEIGGVRPWKPHDRRAATRAAAARERPQPVPGAKTRRRAKPTVARKRTSPARVRKPSAPAPGRITSRRPSRTSPRRAPRTQAAKSDLGDGTVASEIVAAARRLVGIRRGKDATPFLAHLVAVAAVKMKIKAPRDLYNAAAWRHLNKHDKTLDGEAPRPGDLVFFHDTHDRNRDGTVDDPYSMVAVVESIRPSGAMICVGDAYNRVIRFSMNAAQPSVRRDDRSGEVMNTPIRKRTRHDGPETPVLAGQLYAGMARL